MGHIFNFDLEGKSCLGFDTGLDARTFAQAKMARFVTRRGYLVYPSGKTEEWKCRGVIEREGPGGQTMAFWGPGFPGLSLDECAAREKKDDALDALRWWLRARRLLSGWDELPPPWPGGAFLTGGTIFFAPEEPVRRSLEAAGAWNRAVARWVNPALKGEDAEVFTAGALLYRVFCGRPPFPLRSLEGAAAPAEAGGGDDPGCLQILMGEGIFVPPSLEAPGLKKDMEDILRRCLNTGKEGSAVSPGELEEFLGPPGRKPFSSWFEAPGEDAGSLRKKRVRFIRKQEGRLRRRAFFTRHRTPLLLALAGAFAALFIGRSMVKAQAERPSARGMDAPAVVENYYRAFNRLDHELMSACTSNSAGRGDIELAVNFFVIGRVREAYERSGTPFMAAEDWLAAGSPPTDRAVFGITDLSIKKAGDAGSGDEEAVFEAEYRLYVPGSAPASRDSAGGRSPEAPEEAGGPLLLVRKDRVTLTQKRGLWRISRIEREQREGE